MPAILAIAGELAKIQQEDIFCARYGGDEFIIIYEGMTEEAVYDKARKLRENIMALKIAHAYSKAAAVVTISQGICFDMPREENKSWDFLHVADAMLYQVKRRVRNNIVLGDLHSNVLKSGIENQYKKAAYSIVKARNRMLTFLQKIAAGTGSEMQKWVKHFFGCLP